MLLGFAMVQPVSAQAPTPIVDPVTNLMVPDYFGVANWAYSPSLTKFVDKLPGLGSTTANLLGQYIPVAVADTTTYPGSDYYEIAVVEYKEQLHSELTATTLRGYVQISTAAVPGAHVALSNPNGTPINLPNGTRAYGVTAPHYLGPVIVATGALKGVGGKPVRIRFFNLLPTGAGGDLFVPVDTTVMGAGMGPVADTPYTQNRATVHNHGNSGTWISDGTTHQWITPAGETTPYEQGDSVQFVPDMWYNPTTHAIVAAGTPGATNDPGPGSMNFYYANSQSARLLFYHDHAHGITRLNVYIGEASGYLITDQVDQDMIQGTDVSGVNPNFLNVLPDVGIPLVIQDKTFVDPATIAYTDPTWLDSNQPTFGTSPGTAVAGDLWYPHVYIPAQNPYDITGFNAFGRWNYGPWFFPLTANLQYGIVPNPYCLPTPPVDVNDVNWDCSTTPWESPFMPGTPTPSAAAEHFADTVLINGTVYPYMEVEPKAYRFRILNAADDRFFNLQLYVATGIVGSISLGNAGAGYTTAPAVTITNGAGDTTGHGAQAITTIDPVTGAVTSIAITVAGSGYTVNPTVAIAAPPAGGTQATATATFFTSSLPGGQGTEVGMVPVSGTAWLPPFDVSGVADPATAGPSWIQIGTEGGFLPAPVVIPSTVITWNTNPLNFNFGNVKNHSLLLGTAERADVVVDFSAYAGKTLILYNDAPAAFPAPDPRLDYYTNDQDQTSTGGAPTTLPGKGPNTRTLMQIRVGSTVTTPTTNVTLANLQSVFAKTAAKRGVLEVSQEQIIVPQAAYNSAYNQTYPTATNKQYVFINTNSFTFQPINASGVLQTAVTLSQEPKAAHDEMGGVYDPVYGRMTTMLGLELPATNSQIAQFLPYGYNSPPTDLLKPADMSVYPVVTLGDGTQIWKIIHNGVDTHTIHTHLFTAQIINRVGWAGEMLPPDANELGFKDTYRMNPLEQLFLAVRPVMWNTTQVPFLDKIPNSIRLIDPTKPEGAVLDAPAPAGWFDPIGGNAITQILNHKVNFGWEYVWHCHILAHEEMDMMHSLAVAIPPKSPSSLTAVTRTSPLRAVLTWTDNSANETGFTVQRATNSAFTTNLVTLGSVGAGVVTYTDTTVSLSNSYYYRVVANNKVGDTTVYDGIINAGGTTFQTVQADSKPSNTALLSTAPTVPSAPSNLNGTAVRITGSTTQDRVTLTWTDNSNNETGFQIQRSLTNTFSSPSTFTVGVNIRTFTQNVSRPGTYYYRVRAYNTTGNSAWSNTKTIVAP